MGYRAGIITISDKLIREGGEHIQEQKVAALLQELGWEVIYTNVIGGNTDIIKSTLIDCADNKKIPLVVTIGAAGYSDDSYAPEATLAVTDREVRGIPELMRSVSGQANINGYLSRGVAAIRKHTFIVNLPGSAKAATENLAIGEQSIRHVVDMMWPNGTAALCEANR